jgi:hypothetical protein
MTVIDGDFPREVVGAQNLIVGEYRMPARRNSAEFYDAEDKKPAGKREGALKLGALEPAAQSWAPGTSRSASVTFRRSVWEACARLRHGRLCRLNGCMILPLEARQVADRPATLTRAVLREANSCVGRCDCAKKLGKGGRDVKDAALKPFSGTLRVERPSGSA